MRKVIVGRALFAGAPELGDQFLDEGLAPRIAARLGRGPALDPRADSGLRWDLLAVEDSPPGVNLIWKVSGFEQNVVQMSTKHLLRES